ncbi:MAG: methionine gamma-lyase [Chloroflexota bacterium]
MDESPLHFETLAARSGLGVWVGGTKSTVPPITASTTFTYDSVENVHAALESDGSGFAYARNANPTVHSLEEVLSLLEDADDAVAFGSGMGAISATFMSLGLEPGDTIVAARDLYGVTRSVFAQLAQFDIRTVYVDILNAEEVSAAVALPRARALFFESIANPLLQVPDIQVLVDTSRARNVRVVIDNTFATPYLCRPLSLGVDLVIHSATKYIAGHGDVMAGIVAGSRSWAKRLRDARTVGGSVLSPFEAWLTLRGVRTLPLRIERQSASAYEIARWLEKQPWVERVYYPGLDSSPHRDIAARQFNGRFGGMVAVDLMAEQKQTLSFIDCLELITAGTSLGDVASLVLYPPLSSHRGLSAVGRAEAGIGDGLLRISIGLENPDDLIVDLQRAAEKSGVGQGAAGAPQVG